MIAGSIPANLWAEAAAWRSFSLDRFTRDFLSLSN
eukprot:05842.XXX_145241_145345_1 [CDS] Oithona nana genome sequencing.